MKLEGLIDLGPNWNFEYSIQPLRNRYETTKSTTALRTLPSTTSTTQTPTTTTSTTQKPTTTSTTMATKVDNIILKSVTISSTTTTSEATPTTTSQVQNTWPKTTEASKPLKLTQYIFDEPKKKNHLRQRFTKMSNYGKVEKDPVTDTIDTPERLAIDDHPLHDTAHVETTTAKPKDKLVLLSMPLSPKKPINITTNGTIAVLREVTKNYKWMTNNSDIYNKFHKVKDDKRIKEFTVHLMRQNIQVFESLKRKIDDGRTRRKLDSLSKSYVRKFGDFVRENRNQNIKTRLGTQKVILDTISTSNRILQRLVNYYIGNINSNPALRHLGIENVIQSEVNKEIELEYQHACKKFGICRTSEGFQTFFVDILTDLLKNNGSQLRILTDALAESLKNTDFGKVVDWDLQKKLDEYIWELEIMETSLIKPMYSMWRNAVAMRNKPILVMRGVETGLVNKTVAFIDLMDILETKIQPNEANNKLWRTIKSDLSLWTMEPTKIDIQKVVEAIIKHIEYEIDQVDVDTAQDINDKLTIMLTTMKEPFDGPSTIGLFEYK